MSPRWRGMELPGRLVCDESSLTATYGRFIAEPFERGYGITIGNSLRRVLLSSLQGAAVTSVRISGAMHEFSTVPGVKEDAAQIVLNLKQLVVRLHSRDSRTVRLVVEGVGEASAADIETDEGVEILNPGLHIATLNGGAKFEMEIDISTGRGYASAEQNRKEDQPIGVIAVDSMFTPVRRASFEVNDTRVGQRTDYNSLVMDVWTDGTVHPAEAMAQGAEILSKHLSIFSRAGEEPEEEEKPLSEEDKKREEYLNLPVSELELSVRSANCLTSMKVKTIRDLVQRGDSEMLKCRNFGKKSLGELKSILAEMGLELGTVLKEDSPVEENDETP